MRMNEKWLWLFLTMAVIPASKLFSQNRMEPRKSAKLGLVAELMSIKMNAESVTSMALSDTILVKKKDQKDVLEGYTELRIISIPLIAQLIADISHNNNLRIYKKLDNYLTEKPITDINTTGISNSKLRGYIETLKNLDSVLKKFYTKAYELSHIRTGDPRLPALSDFISAFNAIETAVKNFNEAKGKKVDKLVTILDATKMADPNDLMKGGEKKGK